MYRKNKIWLFLTRVRKSVPIRGKERKQLLERLRMELAAFEEEYPGCDYEQIVERFGTPEQIAEDFLAELDHNSVAHALQVRQRIVKILVATALVGVLMWGFMLLCAYLEHLDRVHGYFDEEVITIIDETIYSED